MFEKAKINEKEAGVGPLNKTFCILFFCSRKNDRTIEELSKTLFLDIKNEPPSLLN